MIVAGIIGYYLFAFLLIAAVVVHAVRLNIRDANALYERVRADQERQAYTPPIPPPLPPREDMGDEWDDDDWDDDEGAELDDLSAEELGPIAPLLRRAARQYRDNPADRERLVNSLAAALNPVTRAG